MCRNIRQLHNFEPPATPDVMIRARIAADMPEDERPKVEAMKPASVDFLSYIGAIRGQKRADFTICDVRVGTRIDGKTPP